MLLTEKYIEWILFVHDSLMLFLFVEFNLVSLYTIDTAGSNLEKPFNETDMTAIMMLTL